MEPVVEYCADRILYGKSVLNAVKRLIFPPRGGATAQGSSTTKQQIDIILNKL